MSSGRSLLNRNPRVLRGIRNRMAEALFKCGYTMEQASAAWFDACDMALLQDAATDDQN
jgi:hypothetical protein